jgi:hypothetical protein
VQTFERAVIGGLKLDRADLDESSQHVIEHPAATGLRVGIVGAAAAEAQAFYRARPRACPRERPPVRRTGQSCADRRGERLCRSRGRRADEHGALPTRTAPDAPARAGVGVADGAGSLPAHQALPAAGSAVAHRDDPGGADRTGAEPPRPIRHGAPSARRRLREHSAPEAADRAA